MCPLHFYMDWLCYECCAFGGTPCPYCTRKGCDAVHIETLVNHPTSYTLRTLQMMQDQLCASHELTNAKPEPAKQALSARPRLTRHWQHNTSVSHQEISSSNDASMTSHRNHKVKSQSAILLHTLLSAYENEPSELLSSSLPASPHEAMTVLHKTQITELPQSREMSGSKPAFEKIYPVTPQYMMRLGYERTFFQFVSCLATMLTVNFDSDVPIQALRSRTTTFVLKYEHCRHQLLCKLPAIQYVRSVLKLRHSRSLRISAETASIGHHTNPQKGTYIFIVRTLRYFRSQLLAPRAHTTF